MADLSLGENLSTAYTEGDFGFEVTVHHAGRFGPEWNVQLPHQCDAWEITENLGWDGSDYTPPGPAEVKERLRQFIAEAEATLATVDALEAALADGRGSTA